MNAIISDLLYQNLFKPDQLGKPTSGAAASARATSRPSSQGDGTSSGPMAKHVNNKSTTSVDTEEQSKTRAVLADVSGAKVSSNEKRAEKCKEKCPANIKECCRNAIAGTLPYYVQFRNYGYYYASTYSFPKSDR